MLISNEKTEVCKGKGWTMRKMRQVQRQKEKKVAYFYSHLIYKQKKE